MRIDLEEGSLAALSEEAGITANNTAVGVHRARGAPRRQVALACGACAIASASAARHAGLSPFPGQTACTAVLFRKLLLLLAIER